MIELSDREAGELRDRRASRWIECVRRSSRNVKRWQLGEMALRWTAAGMLEAERQFRTIIGYRDLASLAVAIERHLAHTTVPSPTEEAAILVTA
jgi:hypothetical protein